jgi:hypothetical protein
MDSSEELEFSLKIKNSYYIQFGAKFPMNIPHLIFKNTGDISMEGDDEVGPFKISGELKGKLIFLTKQYIMMHRIYYLGRFNANVLELIWDFQPNWKEMETDLNDSNNAVIEFDSDVFCLKFKNSSLVYDLFLQKGKIEDGEKFYGILNFQDRLVAVHIRMKSDEKCFVEIFAKEFNNKLKGKYDENTKTFTVKQKNY